MKAKKTGEKHNIELLDAFYFIVKSKGESENSGIKYFVVKDVNSNELYCISEQLCNSKVSIFLNNIKIVRFTGLFKRVSIDLYTKGTMWINEIVNSTYQVSNNIVNDGIKKYEYSGNLRDISSVNTNRDLVFNLNGENTADILNNIKIVDGWAEFDIPTK